jgi:hypothetical protein
MTCDLAYFYKGSMQHDYLECMPLSKLLKINDIAKNIINKQNKGS